ncbi:MAG: hypothetical protein KatS3mg111_2594 [Pirellulaceae bacterium]|nr:MAG: hypothetical protein KatS3mg111_2594 [Pirellulaceae bacterium]
MQRPSSPNWHQFTVSPDSLLGIGCALMLTDRLPQELIRITVTMVGMGRLPRQTFQPSYYARGDRTLLPQRAEMPR